MEKTHTSIVHGVLNGFGNLSDKQRRVLALRHGISLPKQEALEYGKLYTFDEIGEIDGLSSQRIHAIEKQGIDNILLFVGGF